MVNGLEVNQKIRYRNISLDFTFIILKTFFSNGSVNRTDQEAAYAECFARELKSLSVVRYKFLHKLFKLILKYLHTAF